MDLKYPDHLAEQLDDTVTDAPRLQKAISESMPTIEQAQKPEKIHDPRQEKQYTFQLDWEDGRGKHWRGTFTNKILNLREHQMVGVMRARLANGLPAESLDTMTSEINLMLSHLTYSLIEKPDWAKDLQNLEDVRIVQELYKEVLQHENTFLGYGSGQAQSAE